ncbi:MAG: hypothetical protein KF864_11930 [Phycisphaeraceae bacterium]|nr:hypothetical protein [Phycisphaeraceae bacterium]
MKKCLLIAALAGAAASASAQTSNPQPIDISNIVAVRAGAPQYGERLSPVWSNGRFPGVNLGFFGAVYDMLDDINFVGGPWAGETGRVITQINVGVGQFSPGWNCTMRFEFYESADFCNATDILQGAAPFASYSINFAGSGSGIYSWFTLPVSIPVPDTDDQIFMRFTILDENTTSVWTGAANAFLPGYANDLTVGSGSPSIAWNTLNQNITPYFAGGCPSIPTGVAATHEHRTIATSGAAGGPGWYGILSGEVTLPDPPGITDLGCLNDGFTTVNHTAAPGEVKWYKFCINGDATDAALQFLDIDTEGSGVDASFAVYQYGTGALLRDDANSGSGDNAQVSFGVGRRGGVGGLDYDGRSGELLASNEYLVAITSGDGVFGPSYSANSAGPGGALRLRFNTNTNGTPLAASVPPNVDSTIYDLGDLTQLSANPPEADMDPNWVVWYRFEVCSDVNDDGNEFATGPYVDVDFTGSFVNSDTDVVVFDGSGNVIASEGLTPPMDDAGAGLFSQISWGDVAPARFGVGGVDFAGQQGNLSAGVYYMAVGLCCINPVDGRWHARSTSGSSLPANFTFFFEGLEECSGGGCSPCAADYNQDGGVDGGDVEAFFIDWENAEGCSDVNEDGGVDGSDVEFFFIVWEQGGC